MALTLLATNNAESTLASAISATDTSLIVSAGTGAEFPDAVAGESYFKLTLTDAATGSQVEIVNVTSKTGDIFTIERAQEGTLARAWAANDMVANMMTADTLNVIADYSKQAADSAEEAKGYALSASEFGDNKFTFYKTSSDPDGTIAGLSATTNGQSFRVAQGVDGTDAFITYQNDNGMAVAQAAQPGTAAITGTVREFSTLSLAENDVAAGNILDGSKCWVANASDITLADEYINNSGTLEATGREMPSQEYINTRDCEVFLSLNPKEFNNDDTDISYAITDQSGNIAVSVDIYGGGSFTSGETGSAANYEFHNNDLSAVYAWTDVSGFVSFYIDDTGKTSADAETGFEFHNDDSVLYYAISGADGVILLGFDSAGVLINGVDKTEIEELQGDVLSLQGRTTALENNVLSLNSRADTTDARVADLATAGLSGYNLYADVSTGIAAGDAYFGVPETSVVALYRNNSGAAELVFRAPDLLNLAGRIELVSDGQLYRDGDSVTVRRQFNSLYTTPAATIIPDYAALIGLYDGLMGEFPDAIKKIEIGDSSVSGAKIYGYVITPPVLLASSNSYAPPDPPRIIINGCIHGHEKPAALSTFVFAQELCQRWQYDDTLECLRHGVEFIFIPGINPYGVNNAVRKNSNGVDLNRNFPYGWSTGGSTDPASENYRGPSAASETETQTYMSFLDNYDSIATLEVHNGAWYPGEAQKQIGWIGTELNPNIFIGAQATRKWNTFAQREFDLTLNGNNSTSRLSKVSDGGNSKYQLNTLGRSSFLFEMPFSVSGSTWKTIYYSVNAFSILCAEIYQNWRIKQTMVNS
ncbi:TPA: M14 family metallopeptidase [Klebsiella pneumoniae]